ncbi:hypothetical protein QLQ12_28235 [Actinoplanes sp. NEAU-A12]|uniref:Uncharacterized protein n=1 Tax=Actinoplanes sandaracinus TaxID=3045177 RepID=A0ABT6WSA7_9ACTN|nr:hypothetical protein [Actinoplanes sandaracinus]MDI6102515.1 hypothetical protein [Actinoplanes sandaracinus]
MVRDLLGDDRHGAAAGQPAGESVPQRPSGEAEAERAGSRETAAKTGPDLILWLHRALTIAAVMGLIVNTRSFWNAHVLVRPGLALVITGAYLAMLIAAVIGLCASRHRTLARLDVGVLATAIVIKMVAAWPGVSGAKKLTVDEGMLMNAAARGLAKGRNPYTSQWPNIDPGLPTQLMDGRTVFDFGYPPLGVEIGAVVQRIFPSLVGIVLVAWLALLATVLFVFFVAPQPLRPIATLGVLGLGTFTAYADNAYPSVIALPFLCLALWSWPSIGRGGRLGRGGVGRAVALGAACSIHQLGWFLALFLVVGLVVLRLRELSLRATFLLLLRYGSTALAVFVLVSVPFIVKSPQAWLTGVFEPLLQHAVPHGQGLMGITHYVIGGSGALDLYGRATIALLAALLVTFAFHLRSIGPAIAVLPWMIFMVSTRSQDGYWLLTMPLWLVALVTTSRADFAGAYRFPLSSRVLKAATVAVFLPAAVCFVVAAATPQPLRFTVTSPVVRGEVLSALTVEVTNRSDEPVTPHFSVVTGVTIAEFWQVRTGPATLPAGATATFTLVPKAPDDEDEPFKIPKSEPAFLRAVSDGPQTLSSVRLTG